MYIVYEDWPFWIFENIKLVISYVGYIYLKLLHSNYYIYLYVFIFLMAWDAMWIVFEMKEETLNRVVSKILNGSVYMCICTYICVCCVLVDFNY